MKILGIEITTKKELEKQNKELTSIIIKQDLIIEETKIK